MDDLGPDSNLWAEWRNFVSGDDDEDLSAVFKHVRRQGTTDTQMKWARDWRTRTFCDLGLHLIYEQHIRRTHTNRTEDSRIFADVKASDLANHAQQGFFDADTADELSVDRFNATWGQHSAYCEDLIAYLFRPAPYLRRLKFLHPTLIEMAQELTLEEWLEQSAKMEIDSLLLNPLVSLHTFVETVLPSRPDVREYVLSLRRLRLQRWADLYKNVFLAYGAPLRMDKDVDWLSIAERFSTIAGGAFVRSQTRAKGDRSPIDNALLGRMVIEVLPALLAIDADDIGTRRLQRAIEAPLVF